MSKKLVSIALSMALLILVSPLYSFAENDNETLVIEETDEIPTAPTPIEIPEHIDNGDEEADQADDQDAAHVVIENQPEDDKQDESSEDPESLEPREDEDEGEPPEESDDAEAADHDMSTDEETEADTDTESEDEEADEYAEELPLPDAIRITLPTTEALSFILDPQGFSGIAEGENVSLDELDKGRILPRISDPAIVLNESSFPILLTIELRAVSKEGGGGNTDKANFVPQNTDLETTKAAVFSDDGNNVLLYAAPSVGKISSPHETFEPAGIGYVITEEPITLEYVLPAAEYALTGEGADMKWELIPGTGSGIQFQISGYVNDNADWSNFTDRHIGDARSTIGLVAVFSYSEYSEEQIENEEDSVNEEDFEDIDYTENEENTEYAVTPTIEEYADDEE